MEYQIKLDLFEGPLDLLLHLISKEKIKIEDVSITEITEQYLDYLDMMKEFNVEIASDFLVMAATLLYIKSKSLLPKLSNEEDEEEDLEEDLLKRLAEYKKYKEASENLREREIIYSNIYYKLPEELLDNKEEKSLSKIEGNPEDLFTIYIKLIKEKRAKNKSRGKVYPVHRETITLDAKIEELKRIIHNNSQCSFLSLFNQDYYVPDIVITFLALLEMLKTNQIWVYQEKQFGDIIIRRAV